MPRAVDGAADMGQIAAVPEVKPRRWPRRVLRAGGVVLVLALVLLALTWFSTGAFSAFGGTPSAATRARIEASPQFVGGHFQNREPTILMAASAYWPALKHWLTGDEMRFPSCPLPVVPNTAARLAVPAQSGLRITWLGHSSTLIEIDGAIVLTDPMWADRASPSSWIGPKRFHPPPLSFAALPHIDAVLISHEHYDHLDMGTIQALAIRGVEFHVPLGIAGHLESWGVPPKHVVEHDWWQDAKLANGVRVVSTPARHFNGRGVPWRTGALWTSWAIVGPAHRVFFSGDTGLTESFREIAVREGPFDVAMLEIGQYHPTWGSIHLGPEGALDAFTRIGAKTLIPIHWGTFVLAYHAWSEPVETLVVEAAKRNLTVATPGLGEPIEPAGGAPTPTTSWWRALPPIAKSCPP
jgi:L-ascorbate metabolism protein UlaG (beta-lactamase superfamily)